MGDGGRRGEDAAGHRVVAGRRDDLGLEGDHLAQVRLGVAGQGDAAAAAGPAAHEGARGGAGLGGGVEPARGEGAGPGGGLGGGGEAEDAELLRGAGEEVPELVAVDEEERLELLELLGQSLAPPLVHLKASLVTWYIMKAEDE